MSARATELLRQWGHLSGSDLDCPPRWGTPRTPERATYGPHLAEIAEQLGKPFQPWQHYVTNTAMEIDPATNRLVYGIITLTLPRQNGKTTLTIPLMTHRCLAWSRQIVLYAAQTRDAALEKLRIDHEPMLAESPFADRYTPSWDNNRTGLHWDNGSNWSVTATTKTAGHGPTLHLGVLDEAWAQKDNRVEAAWLPAMLTTDSQMWLPSTMGDETSTFFHSRVDDGRAIVESGSRTDIAHFEWSADEDADPFDPATWATCMPALGHTVTVAKIRQAQMRMADDPADFARAYCNIRKGGAGAVGGAIEISRWEALADTRSRIPDAGVVALGVEVDVDQGFTSVAVAGVRSDGRMHLEIIRHERGSQWVAEFLVRQVARWKPCGIGIDLGGPAGVLRASLANAGLVVWRPGDADGVPQRAAMLTVPTIREYAQASGELVAAVKADAPMIVHLGADAQPQLSRAVAGAKTRPLGDAFAFGRRGNASIAPLVAATLARWVYLLRAPAYDRDNYDVALSVY